MSWLFVAVHLGPYHSLVPVERALGEDVVFVVDGVASLQRHADGAPHLAVGDIERRYGDLAGLVAALRPRALVRGTSDDVAGANIEQAAAAAATKAGVAVFIVEDFPGNHWPGPERLDGLFVEDDGAAALQRARGVPGDRVYPTGNPRYDALRTIDAAEQRAITRHRLGLDVAPVTLWVGQPDAEASYRTLEVVLPRLARLGATLLFRAHPRDGAWEAGRYDALLAGARLRAIDVTRVPDVVGLCCASDLVVTQFSSVAVEAGFLGTPALFVVLPGLGADYLRERKGYAVPPWGVAGAAFVADTDAATGDIVERALCDPNARRAVRAAFVQRYASRPPSAPAVAAVLRGSA